MDAGVALVAAAVASSTLPATFAAFSTRKKLKMKNGTAIGQRVEEIHENQKLVALALVSAQSKVDDVARALAISEVKRDDDRKVVAEHITDDKVFQARIEPFLKAAGGTA